MRRYFSILFLTLAIGFGFLGCSKDDTGKDANVKSSLTMKVDGKPWGTTINNLFTEEHESSEFGEYYVVLVGGQSLDVEDSEEDVSSFNMYIAIPKSRFKNPKGTYTVRKESEIGFGEVSASFVVSTSEHQLYYASYNPELPTETVGTVEITGFETGIQTVVGHSTGTEGYTKLSGTFKMDLYSGEVPPVKITEGKFNLKSGIGFDFR